MSSLFSFASESHPVWTPFAAEIHKTVWDRVGLANVQEFVCQWADDRDEASRKRARTEKAERDRIRVEVVDHWSESLGVPRVDCYGLLPGAFEVLAPPNPVQPLPPDHQQIPLSSAAKWAGLAAIHDVYWKGDKINPWPYPADAIPPWTLPPDGQRYLEVQKAWEGSLEACDEVWPYKRTLDWASRLSKDDARVVAAWLRELAPPKPTGNLPANDGDSPDNASAATAANSVGTRTEPKPEAFQAYWLEQAGKTQQQIAEILLESATRQGTISRWIAGVKRWRDAGNKMPEITKVEPLHGKPAAIDPAKLDLGPRADHRPEHTRAKLAKISGHGWDKE